MLILCITNHVLLLGFEQVGPDPPLDPTLKLVLLFQLILILGSD